MTSEHSSLKRLNIVNVLGYILNAAIVFGFGTPSSNAEFSLKYQTLVTPSAFAFAIWGLIFTTELIWVGVQLLPTYRSNDIVVHGVGWGWVVVCLAQAMWTILFSLEQITLSFIAMVIILIPLVVILTKVSQIDTSSSSSTTSDYWLLKFCFEIHAAWIMAATLVNFNVTLVAWQTSATIQIIAAWLSLVTVLIVSFFYTFLNKKKPAVCAVLTWASFGIMTELTHPKTSITATFSLESIQAVRTGAMVVTGTGIILVIIGLSQIIRMYFSSSRRSVENDEPISTDDVVDDDEGSSVREPLVASSPSL